MAADFVSHSSISQRIVRGVAYLTVGIGLLGLINRSLNLQTQFHGQILPSQTALVFVCCGIALYCANNRGRNAFHRYVVTTLSLLMVFAGGLKFTEIMMHMNLGNTFTKEMSVGSAANFILVGLALLVEPYFKMLPIFQTCILSIGIGGWLGLSQYIYGGTPLSIYSKMSAGSALNFMLLSVGMLFLRPEISLAALLLSPRQGGKIVRRLIPALLFVSIVVGGLRMYAQHLGWFDTEIGLTLFALANMIILGGLTWSSAAALNRADELREKAEIRASLGEAARARLGAIVESTSDAIVGKDLNGVVTSWNKGAEIVFGFSSNEMIGTSILRLIPLDRHDEEQDILAKIRRGERIENFETLRKTKDGSLIDVSVTISPILDSDRNLIGISKIARNVTDRKQQEIRIQHLNRVYAVLSDINQMIVREKQPLMILESSCNISVERGRFVMAWIGLLEGSRAIRLVAHAGRAGRYLEKLKSALTSDLQSHGPTAAVIGTGEHVVVNDIEHDPLKSTWREDAMAEGFRASAAFPIKVENKIAGTFNLYANELGFFNDEEVKLLKELTMDIGFALEVERSEVKRHGAEEARRISEAKYRVLFDHAPDAIVIADSKSRYLDANASMCRMLGYTLKEFVGLHASDIVVPTEIEHIQPALDAIKTQSEYHREWQFRRKDGSTFEAEVVATTMPDGNILGMIRDVTSHRKLENQLRQTQKMEAIGQLAGGIAHDFNNLLTVINGRSLLVMNRFNSGNKTRQDAELIYQTGERAAALTRQLLAFSRQQVLAPVVLDLNKVAAEMDSLLRRLIREDIELSTVLAPELKYVKADPTQIEQVIINLVVNARDALSEGGKIIIETANVELNDIYCRTHPDVKPGQYVMLAVSDTGHGMDSNVKAKIFEPFFTTKPHGMGTGLGLATVFGVIKQSNGVIEVYSEVGKGTTFKVYLPQTVEALTVTKPGTSFTSPKGHEIIFVVEDEDGVRELLRDLLEMNGYTIHAAKNGIEALRRMQEYTGTLDLIITDVVMPGMGGPELIERIKSVHPEAKVLFTSGYTDHAIIRNGSLPSGASFIQKPFTPASLARKVREILDAQQPLK